MKLVRSLLCLLLISVCAHAQLPNSLTNGLIAFYPFDGNGNDASGNGRNLVLGENTFTNGIRGQGMSVFGGNQASFGESRALPLLMTNAFAFSFWIKPETLNRGWPEWIYLIDGNAEFMNVGLRIGVNDGSQVPAFRNLGSVQLINGGGGGTLNSYETTNNGSIRASVWNHIVVAANGTSEIAIYANGSLLQRWTNTPEFLFDQNNFFLGNGRGNQYPLQGQLDQIRVYNRALSSNEVTALYNRDRPIAPPVNIETVLVGDAGNAADPLTGFGAVSYPFHIGKFEVTIEQYAAFLNAVATTSTNSYILDLWNPAMADSPEVAGITRTGNGTAASPYSYSPIGTSNRPIAFVSWFDAARFCNFLHNGATNGASTETGAYTLNGATNGIILKNSQATHWIPSLNEFYKASYYKGQGTNSGYWLFPTRSDTTPVAQPNPSGASANSANYGNVRPSNDRLTPVGSYSASAGPYGTFDQGGNLSEWNDAVNEAGRGLRGGYWGSDGASMLSEVNSTLSPNLEGNDIGFRIATRESASMVIVKGGVLPSSSELSGQSVNSFRIGKTETTWGEWKQVRDWAVSNGYPDLSNIGTGGSDKHPVRLVNWYDAVKWCNAKSEKEGLKPVYYRSGQVYRQGEGPSDSPYDPNSPVQFVIDRDSLANGYRLATDAEWEWAARGGVSSRDFIYSGSDDLNAVGWFTDNSSGAPAAFLNGRGTYPVGLKQPNELGIYDMSGNASEWVWDPLGDWRRVRGGAFHYLAEQCVVSRRSADAAGYRDSDTYVKGGFRVARNIPSDFDSDEDGVNDYREGKDGTNPNDASSFNPLSKGLIGFYPFEGDGNDDSGYGRNLRLRLDNGNSFDTNGLKGQSLGFGQGQAYASHLPSYEGQPPNVQPLYTNAGSFSLWIRASTLSRTFPEWIYLIEGSTVQLRIGANDGSEYPDFKNIGSLQFLNGSSGTGFYGWYGTMDAEKTQAAIRPNVWTHIVITANSTNEAAIYANGQLLDKWTNITEFVFDQNNYAFGNGIGYSYPFRGQMDQIRVYNRSLSSRDVENLFYTEAFSDMQKQFLVSTPWVMGHFSQAEYNGNRTNGQTDVTTNPSAFNLFTQSQFDGNRTAGQNDVISNPMFYGLYTSNSIMDLRMGGLMIQRQGNNASVVFQLQSTTNLSLPFTNNGVPITNTVPMPSNKGFLRIQVK